ncbi:SAP domain protein [Aciduliprofundum boonei T469]|nr:SAP domain protein [Aciduliprofundum boonei T469]
MALKYLSYDELREIASFLKIKGRSKMSSDELRNSIINLLKNEDFVLDILKTLNENALRILDILRDYDGKVERKKVLQELGKSQTTFRKYTQVLEGYGFLYYDFDNDSFYVPKEILRYVNDFVMEKEEKMEFEDFLYVYLTVEQLREICRKYKLSTSGKKDDLIQRIISSSISEIDILKTLSVYDLKWIAEDMGLTKSGKKDEIIKRIMEQIKVSKVRAFEITKEKINISKEHKKSPKRGLDALWEEIAEAIDRDFHPSRPVHARLKERQVEDSLKTFLEGRFPSHKIEIEKTKRESRIDLSVDGKIGIELKYNPKDYDRVVGQVERYLSDFPRIIVVISITSSDEKLIKKANSAKPRIESKGAKVIIKVI